MKSLGPMGVEYAVALYAELLNRATKPGEDSEIGIFEGSKVTAFRSLGISQTYYSILFSSLRDVGSIEDLRRGSKHQPSIVRLHGWPNRDELAKLYRSHLTRRTSADTMHERVTELEAVITQFGERIERLEALSGSQAESSG